MRIEPKSRAAAALMSLMMGCWATLASAGTGDGVSSLCSPCTEPNGRGIYIADPEHYCIEDKVDGIPMRFCPEAFVAKQAQGGVPAHVELVGTFFKGEPLQETAPQKSLTVYVKLSSSSWVPLLAAKAAESNSRLTLSYKKSNLSPQTNVSGADLKNLTLLIPSPFSAASQISSMAYQLNFEQVLVPATGPSLDKYMVTWKSPKDPSTSRALCSGGGDRTMTMLPGKRVDGTSGMVTDRTNMTTMGCATGAIGRCMSWGYGPGAHHYMPDKENELLSACIQAKRAAYFGGPKSYTVNGHTINMQDFMPILNYEQVKKDNIDRVEAIWTAEKAYCVNKKNRRVNPPDAPEFPDGWENHVKECGYDALPHGWWKNGVIVTGTAPDTAPAPSP